MLQAELQVFKHRIHLSSSELFFCNLNVVFKVSRSHLFFKVNKRFGSVPWKKASINLVLDQREVQQILCVTVAGVLADTGRKTQPCTCRSLCSSRMNR